MIRQSHKPWSSAPRFLYKLNQIPPTWHTLIIIIPESYSLSHIHSISSKENWKAHLAIPYYNNHHSPVKTPPTSWLDPFLETSSSKTCSLQWDSMWTRISTMVTKPRSTTGTSTPKIMESHQVQTTKSSESSVGGKQIRIFTNHIHLGNQKRSHQRGWGCRYWLARSPWWTFSAVSRIGISASLRTQPGWLG